MSNHLFLISVLYGFSGIVYFAIAIRGILRRNELRIFDLVRLMYSFVYGVIPFVLYWRESNGERNLYFYDYGLSGLTITFLHSILIVSFTTLFANLIGFLPMQLGVQEGGFVLSIAALGLSAALGIFVSIICRVREIIWIIIGIGLMKLKS